MEKMPYREQPEEAAATADGLPAQGVGADWRTGLPVLCGQLATLRELRMSDAPSLLAALTTEDVTRFISLPPTTVEGFERFILWMHRQRVQGKFACFAVVPAGGQDAVGLFQVRQLEQGFGTAEWGFALGSAFWGTGIFPEAARFVIDFVFATLRSHRLEARAAVLNGRGNGALKKVCAVQEGILRRSLFRHGVYLDQLLWTLLDEDRRLAPAVPQSRVH